MRGYTIMMMTKSKSPPIYLNLVKIRLPVPGVLSILHRITGVLLVVLTPVLMYLLQRSLEDGEFFNRLTTWCTSFTGRIVTLFVVWLFAQHFYSGMRHLLLDIDIGISKRAGAIGAWAAFAAVGVTLLVVGVAL